MDVPDRIAERKLAEAVALGLRDGDPGRCEREDLSRVHDDVRAGCLSVIE